MNHPVPTGASDRAHASARAARAARAVLADRRIPLASERGALAELVLADAELSATGLETATWRHHRLAAIEGASPLAVLAAWDVRPGERVTVEGLEGPFFLARRHPWGALVHRNQAPARAGEWDVAMPLYRVRRV